MTKNIENFRSIHDCAELIFVDGGSEDLSLEILKENGFRVISCERGRARQMNFGAQISCGNTLLFLHADTQVPVNFSAQIEELLAPQWGFFCLALSNSAWPFRLVASSINFRSRIFKVATGDQGIFIKRKLFAEIGGFPNIELMEDIEITRRLKKLGSPKILTSSLVTSARRWEKHGILVTVLQMWFLQLLYKCGVSASRISQWYK